MSTFVAQQALGVLVESMSTGAEVMVYGYHSIHLTPTPILAIDAVTGVVIQDRALDAYIISFWKTSDVYSLIGQAGMVAFKPEPTVEDVFDLDDDDADPLVGERCLLSIRE